MKQFHLRLHLEEAAVFSASAATLGGHHSLDYIPGASLLGACAAKLYAPLKDQAFDVFHSGKVRFGNAYPLTQTNAPCYPMPFSWFYAKGDQNHSNANNRVNAKHVFNMLRSVDQQLPDNQQPVQMRDGYVSDQLFIRHPHSALRMKTAIDPTTARAASSQLFGYQSLEAGQSFLAQISLDDDISDTLMGRIQASLEGVLLLGRSRSAQYGKVCSKQVDIEIDPACDAKPSDAITLWLHADLALSDNNGLPVTADTLAAALFNAFSIAPNVNNVIDWRKSYCRFRRYSPYNMYRKAYDMARYVIEKGSVLHLHLANPVDIPTLPRYIGLYQCQGLGRIAIDHPLLADAHPNPNLPAHPLSVQEKIQPVIPSVAKPEHALVDWLVRKQQSRHHQRKDQQRSETLGKELISLYDQARVYAGAPQGHIVGPSATQWGRVAQVGKHWQNDQKALCNALFGEFANTADAICKTKNTPSNQAICKPGDKDWCQLSFKDKAQTSFADWLRESLAQDMDQAGWVISLVARIAQHHIHQQKSQGA